MIFNNNFEFMKEILNLHYNVLKNWCNKEINQYNNNNNNNNRATNRFNIPQDSKYHITIYHLDYFINIINKTATWDEAKDIAKDIIQLLSISILQPTYLSNHPTSSQSK